MTTPFWTPERLEELRAGVARGDTYAAIARSLGVTKNAALGKARRMGFERADGASLNKRQRTLRDTFLRQRPPVERKTPPLEIMPPPGHCLFAAGTRPDWKFCGEPVRNIGEAWCANHHSIVYLKAPPHG